MTKRPKYYVLDTLLEEGFVVGDRVVLSSLMDRDVRTIARWFETTNYRVAAEGRFIIFKNPRHMTRKVYREYSKEFKENTGKKQF